MYRLKRLYSEECKCLFTINKAVVAEKRKSRCIY